MRAALLLAALVWFGLAALPSAAQSAPAEDVRAVDGVLTVTLTASAQKVDFGPTSVDGLVYNGHYGGPMLRARPGDVLRITLINHLNEPTNLHFHGIETSPLGNSDNVHLAVAPGASQLYEVKIPKTQPPGAYWYHAHVHHLSERQVMGGLSGPLMIEGFVDQFPELAGIREQFLGMQEITFDASPNAYVGQQLHDRVQTINGRLDSRFSIRPGETQLWHVINCSANLAIDLVLEGHHFRIIGEDGVATRVETVTDVLRVKPAGRFSVLVDSGPPGSYRLISKRVPTGVGTEKLLDRSLGALVVEGATAGAVSSLRQFPDAPDLRQAKISASRSVAFSENKAGTEYYVDGRKFDPERVDVRVPLGSIEEWTISNESDDQHVFHIHQVHFQVTRVGEQDMPFDGYIDTVWVPERSSVVVRIAFTHPEIVGKFMYHCHILEHEDKGMMAQIEIYDPATPAPTGSLYQRLVGLLRRDDNSLLGSICRFAGAT